MSRIAQDYLRILKGLDVALPQSDPRHYIVVGKNAFLAHYFLGGVREALSRSGGAKPVTYFYSEIDWDDDDLVGQASLFEEASLRIIMDIPCPKGIPNISRVFSGLHRYVLAFLPTDDSTQKGIREISARKDVQLVPCDDPSVSDMKALGLEMASRLGISLSPSGWRSVLASAGLDPAHLRNDLRMQSLIWHQCENLGEGEISAAAGYLREEKAFKLSDLLLQNDLAAAESLLKDLEARGESPLALIGLLARHCRNALLVSEMARSGAPVGKIASELRLPPFVISAYSQYGRSVEVAKIASALSSLAWSDRRLKSSSIPESLLFGSLISELT